MQEGVAHLHVEAKGLARGPDRERLHAIPDNTLATAVFFQCACPQRETAMHTSQLQSMPLTKVVMNSLLFFFMAISSSESVAPWAAGVNDAETLRVRASRVNAVVDP